MMKTRVKALITTPSSNLAVVAQLTLFLNVQRILQLFHFKGTFLLVVDLRLDPYF